MPTGLQPMRVHLLKHLATWALAFLLFGCSSVPGLSIVSDAIDLQKLASEDPGDLEDEEIRSILEKPLPPPPGMSHDMGLLRRVAAAFAMGDLVLTRQVIDQAKRSSTNDELLKNLLALGVTAEALHGNLEQALKDAAQLELRMQAIAKRTKRPVLTSLNDIDAVYQYIEIAYTAGNLALGERIRKQYLDEIIANPSASQPAKILARLRSTLTEGRAVAFRGDLDGGFERINKGLEQYQMDFTGLKDRSALEPKHERRLRDVYLALGQIAVAQGRYSLALQHLTTMRASLVASRRIDKGDSTTLHMLEATYWGSLGEYQRAMQAVDARWKVIPARWHKLPWMKGTHVIQRSGLLASLGKWDEAWQEITLLSEKDLGEPGLIRDFGTATRALVAAVLGKPDPSINNFMALDRKYRAWKGTDLSTAYFAAKTMVHAELSHRERREHHLEAAVAAGREMSNALNARQARGSGRESTLGPTLMRRAKESYLQAASAMAGREGVTTDDVLDALQLSQSNEVDQDVSSAAARLRTIQGVSAARLRELQDLQQRARGTQALVSEYSRSLDAVPAKLAGYVADANQAAVRLDRLVGELRVSAPQLTQAFGQGGKRLALGQFQQRLQAQEALVVLMPMESTTFVLFISKDGSEHRLLPINAKDVRELVQRIRRSTTFIGSEPLPSFDTEASRVLYQHLFGWLGKRMHGVKALTVSASGDLAAIPFALLLQPGGAETDPKAYATLPWLIKSTAVSHVPSLASWLVVTDLRGRPSTQGFLAWADPDFSGGAVSPTISGVRGAVRHETRNASATTSVQTQLATALPSLPETAEEAQKIARTLGAARQDVLLAGAATRQSVMARSASGELSRKNVLMFATHGLTPADIPGLMQPALALAQESPGKGPSLLLLEDVMGLNLNAEWVVLSACNTASADRLGGDPLSGLARGFFFAGARGMLVTHWEVETLSAAAITQRTFEHYTSDRKLSRAQALQRTSLELIESRNKALPEWSHPAYWAPYALVGNGRRGVDAR